VTSLQVTSVGFTFGLEARSREYVDRIEAHLPEGVLLRSVCW